MSLSLTLVLVLLALIARETRSGRRIARNEPGLALGPGQRFRTLLLQVLEPVLALAVVGSVLVNHYTLTLSNTIAAACGLLAGVAVGAYRARSTYVRAVPAHRGVILRFSVETVVVLILLVGIKVVAEQDLLPTQGVFPAVLVGLLTFLVVESVTRAGAVVRWYRRDAHPAASSAPTRTAPGGHTDR